jgi:hypothetical protein
VKRVLIIAILLGASGAGIAGHEPAAVCPVEGDIIHWIADYCMARIGTDDEIAASDCIDRERRIVFDGACAAKLHYKRAMCELAVHDDTGAASVAVCVADPSFKGRTVRNRGVGN